MCRRSDAGSRSSESDAEVDQRAGDADADVTRRALAGMRAIVLHERDAADREEHDPAHLDARADRDQRVRQFMQHDRAKHQPDEREAAGRQPGPMVADCVNHTNISRKKKREVQAQFHAK